MTNLGKDVGINTEAGNGETAMPSRKRLASYRSLQIWRQPIFDIKPRRTFVPGRFWSRAFRKTGSERTRPALGRVYQQQPNSILINAPSAAVCFVYFLWMQVDASVLLLSGNGNCNAWR